MKHFDTVLLIIIILMGLWIIYRDYTSDDRHLNLTEQAINNVLFVEYETD